MTLTSLEPTNTKISVLRAWLARPPSAAKTLVLRATAGTDAPDVQLGTWDVSEVVPELATEVMQSLDEHASSIGGSIDAQISFRNAAGEQVKTKSMKRGTSAMPAPESLSDVVLDGSGKSQVVQAQAAMQSMMQLMLRSNAVVLQQSVQLCAQATEVTKSLADELASMRGRYREEAREVERLRDEIERAPRVSGDDQEPEQGVAALVTLLQPHLPVILQLVQQLTAPKVPALQAVS